MDVNIIYFRFCIGQTGSLNEFFFFFKHKRNSITPPHSRKTGSWVWKKGKKETKKRKEWLRVLLSFWMYEHSIGKNNNIGWYAGKR